MSYGINDPSQIPAHLLADPENAEVVREYKLSVNKKLQAAMGDDGPTEPPAYVGEESIPF